MNSYTINQGDTLSGIAMKQGMTTDALLKLNPTITDPNKISAGATLNLAAPTPTATAPMNTGSFMVNQPTPNYSTATAIPVAPLMAPATTPNVPAPINNAPTANASLSAATAAVHNNYQAPAQPTTPAGATGTPATSPATATPNLSTSDAIKQKLLELMGVQSTRGTETTRLQTAAGVDDKTLALTKLQNDAIQLKASYDNQIRDIRQNNPSGQLTGAQNDTINQLTRNRDQALADNAIQSLVAQNNLNAALKIADLKITAEFQPVEDQINTLKTYFSIFQNDMTDSEKMKAQAAITQQTNDMTALRTAKSDAVTKLINAGQYTQAKADMINAAKTAADVDNALVGLQGSANLSPTQVNDGATRSGYDVTSFRSLPPDVQVFYSQTTDTNIQPFKDELSKVVSGDETVDDFNSFIDKQAISANVKAYFKQVAAQAAASAPQKSRSTFLDFIGWPQ